VYAWLPTYTLAIDIAGIKLYAMRCAASLSLRLGMILMRMRKAEYRQGYL